MAAQARLNSSRSQHVPDRSLRARAHSRFVDPPWHSSPLRAAPGRRRRWRTSDLADSRFRGLLDELRQSAIAIETAAANEQHYELPTRFFQLCLGKRLKYSSCFYPTGNESLDDAEEAMLALYAERAELADGQHILELGCGWGSLTLWMAEHYPHAGSRRCPIRPRSAPSSRASAPRAAGITCG